MRNISVFSAVVAILFIAGASSYITRKNVYPPPKEFNYESGRRKLAELLDRDGPERAYEYFRVAYLEFDINLVHSLAHFMGEELYLRRGADGFALCDSSYSFGCQHGFFALAIGIDADPAQIAQQICRDRGDMVQTGSCFHGIGHGIMGTKSYDRSGLLGALGSCEHLMPTAHSECYRGVFMEYNRRKPLFAYKNGETIRPLNPAKPYEPCSEIPERYQPPCYVEQAAWWALVLPERLNAERTRKIGALCADAEGPENRRQCFRGMGLTGPTTPQETIDRVRTTCASIPDIHGAAACIDGGVGLILQNFPEQGGNPPYYLCETLDTSLRDACVESTKRYLCGALTQCN